MNARGENFASGALLVTLAAALLIGERLRPLRGETQPKLGRNLRNLAMAAVSGATVALLERPIVEPLARAVERRRLGLLGRAPLPPWARLVVGAALMDYTLYLWHRLMHRWTPLWRLHQPHHADLDLDASTALRFHAAELAASVPWRAAQVALIGAGPRTLAVWQAFTLGCILFHHANLRLPTGWERRIGLVLATPRMHGIHHSTVREETESNWSSGLSLWDRLHGTLRLDIPQDRIEIGVPAWRDPAELGLMRILAMPFRRQRPTWRDPDGLTRRRGPDLQLQWSVA